MPPISRVAIVIHLPLLAALALAAAGCGDDAPPSTGGGGGDPTVPGDGGSSVDPPDYHPTIEGLVAEHCLGCHREGGIGPFRLDGYERLAPVADLALASIELGRMPPWQPDPDCRSFVGENVLDDGERALFRAWVDAGTPLGDPANAAPPPPEPPVFDATHEATITGGEGYVPDPGNPDDYRCFVLDVDIPREAFLLGSEVVPDVGSHVHHVLVYALDGGMAEDLEAAEAADPAPGYECFGGPNPAGRRGLPNQIGAWVPGRAGGDLPEGQGIRIPAESRIVVQVHYNQNGGPPPRGDDTAFLMKLDPEPPPTVIYTRPQAILNIPIPAGEPEVVHSRSIRNRGDEPVVIHQLAAHMHLLGSSFDVVHEKADGSEECMLSIPEWDFAWQGSYQLPPGDEIVVAPGDGLRLTCRYDNSPDNQPIVNGEQVAPRDVRWGEGTLDEMCLLYMTVEEDGEPSE